MNDNAKKWVAALRSGKYLQGVGVLRNVDNQFCCLGVLCELAVSEQMSERTIDSRGLPTYDRCIAVLPVTVRKWVALTPVGESTCMGWNDSEKKSFSEIADLIESEPEGLFE